MFSAPCGDTRVRHSWRRKWEPSRHGWERTKLAVQTNVSHFEGGGGRQFCQICNVAFWKVENCPRIGATVLPRRKRCSRIAHVLLTYCSRIAHVLLTYCSRIAHVLLTYCSRIAHVFSFAHVLLTYCSRIAHVLPAHYFTYCSRIAHVLPHVLPTYSARVQKWVTSSLCRTEPSRPSPEIPKPKGAILGDVRHCPVWQVWNLQRNPKQT